MSELTNYQAEGEEMELISTILPETKPNWSFEWPKEVFERKGKTSWRIGKGFKILTRNTGRVPITFKKLRLEFKDKIIWDQQINLNCTLLTFAANIFVKPQNCVIRSGDPLKMGLPEGFLF